MDLNEWTRGWAHCQRCGLSLFRRHVVIGEGALPCELLFIGKGPGKTEDLRCRPFIGPAGRILRLGIETGLELAGLPQSAMPTHYITNLVSCRPTDGRFKKNRQPTGEEIWACWPRLKEIVFLAQATRVILLGEVAKRHCKQLCPDAEHLVHPSYINRVGGTESIEYRRFCRSLADILTSMRGGRHAEEESEEGQEAEADPLSSLRA